MPDREKVMKGLEVCTTKPCYCTDCPYKKTCALDSQELMEDALALLKEQEPRVMTWDELMRCKNGDPAFIEARDRSGCWELIYPRYMRMNDKKGYGVKWRYWTSRPSPEQMRETKWEETDNGE